VVSAGAPSVLASQFIRALTAADITNSSTQKFWSGNSNIYEIVFYSTVTGGRKSWTESQALAKSKSIAGSSGYLATITSTSEWDFITTSFFANRVVPSGFIDQGIGIDWITVGAYVPAGPVTTSGNWKWAGGPELDQTVMRSLWVSGGYLFEGGGHLAWAKVQAWITNMRISLGPAIAFRMLRIVG
jgi:hypothetical protein